nr:hypothetical protein CFP56_69426 [Quercus suber]
MKKNPGPSSPSPKPVVQSTGNSMVREGSGGCNGKDGGVSQEEEVQGLAGNGNSVVNAHNSMPDFTHGIHNMLNQDFMSKTVTEEQPDTQLKATDTELAKSNHQDFNSFNPLESASRAPACPSAQTQNNEASASHDAARVHTPSAPLRVLPKWSRRVREVNPLARSVSEPFLGKKRATSDLVICYDSPSKRQQVYQSDVEEIFEVVEADHQPHQEQ